jgi:hypothetical protein
MVYLLHRAAGQVKKSAEKMLSAAARNESVTDKLRDDLTTALARVDAERLYSVSLSLQRLVKSFSNQVDQLQRAVFAQPASSALDFSQAGMAAGLAGTELDDEAADDARMLADRARWQAAAIPAGATGSNPLADPLANLSEEDKSRRVMEYFERRRAVAAGFPYVEPSPSPVSTPPAAGSGAYASLLEEASQRPQPTLSPHDFSGLEPEEGVDLSEKGELT